MSMKLKVRDIRRVIAEEIKRSQQLSEDNSSPTMPPPPGDTMPSLPSDSSAQFMMSVNANLGKIAAALGSNVGKQIMLKNFSNVQDREQRNQLYDTQVSSYAVKIQRAFETQARAFVESYFERAVDGFKPRS